jgi:hypothetical protein
MVQLPIDDDSKADTPANGYGKKMIHALPGSEPLFRQSQCVYIVVDVDWDFETILQGFLKIEIMPAKDR